MSRKIKTIHADEILDSRGNPTVQATVVLQNGLKAAASVPSGASTGKYEAHELRDGGTRYGGKGVRKAVKNAQTVLAQTLRGVDVMAQSEIDARMIARDGTPNKSRLGANAILAVSLACARAGALARRSLLYEYLRWLSGIKKKTFRIPTPTMNVLNGGMHAGWCLDVQEFMIVPQQKTFEKKLQCGAEVFHCLGDLLESRGFGTQVGDEGGYAVKLKSNEEGLRMLIRAITHAGYKVGGDVKFSSDVAASEFFQKKTGKYKLKRDNKTLSRVQMLSMYERWIKKYPFVSLEDPLDQDDWEGWAEATRRLGGKVILVGDDLFVTNVSRLRRGIDHKVANAILVKLNQIGTLTETFAAIFLAKKYGYKISVSHRSGETDDDFIADLAVAVSADFVKFGSLSRGERLAKYNRLLEIEEEIR